MTRRLINRRLSLMTASSGSIWRRPPIRRLAHRRDTQARVKLGDLWRSCREWRHLAGSLKWRSLAMRALAESTSQLELSASKRVSYLHASARRRGRDEAAAIASRGKLIFAIYRRGDGNGTAARGGIAESGGNLMATFTAISWREGMVIRGRRGVAREASRQSAK